MQANFGADQLAGSVGVRWMPTEDVDLAHLPSNPARVLCQQIQDAAGNKAVAETDLTVQLADCAQLFLLKHGLEHATGVTPTDILREVGGLGTTNATAAGGMTDSWSSTKPWGATRVRSLKYVASCSCFQYYGAATAVG